MKLNLATLTALLLPLLQFSTSYAEETNTTVWGKIYPDRRDDVAYENELVGFRIYGPGTQQAGEKAFGYDLFFKHPTDELIVPQLYAPETDPAVWARVDSLRNISDELANEYINSFSYHIDHGLGMDCYAVGPTLGAGVAALANADSIFYPWCYEKAEIIENGPKRFTVRLDFAPVLIEGDTVTEHRIISLDSGSHLNKTTVWFDGLSKPMDIVAGFPLRDDFEPAADEQLTWLAYSDPTQGPDNGRAMLGVVMATPAKLLEKRDRHILLRSSYQPGEEFNYWWGFAWDRADIDNFDDWQNYLRTFPFK